MGLRESRVWKSIFRGGLDNPKLRYALAVKQNLFLHVFPVRIRQKSLDIRNTWFLGTLSAISFLLLIVTGILLMLYYHPSAPQAYDDMKDLRYAVSAGIFLRNLHRWSAHAMVILVFAHMFRVFFRDAYRPPREFNWIVGIFLLLLTLLLSYTGYLLPWDQLAFWAITVGTNILSTVPAVGREIRFLMLGGNTVNANALLRFYVLHCVILPLIAVGFLGVHFWRIRKDGGLYSTDKEYTQLDTWPDGIYRIVVAAEILIVALCVLSLVWDAPLEGLADPLQTPNPAKAPWYFLGLQELLHYFPPIVAGVLIPGLVIVALVVIPYFRVNFEPEPLWSRNRARRAWMLAAIAGALAVGLAAFKVWVVLAPTLLATALMAWAADSRRWFYSKPLSFWIMNWFLVVSVLLTAMGTWFRGAGWTLMWPWQI